MGVNLSKIKKHKERTKKTESKDRERRTKYMVIKRNGKVIDIKLGFGSYVGMRITEMLHDPGAINYIKTFLLNPEAGFPDKFTRKVKRVFEKNYDDFLEDDIPF